jgi:hypothetical protein
VAGWAVVDVVDGWVTLTGGGVVEVVTGWAVVEVEDGWATLTGGWVADDVTDWVTDGDAAWEQPTSSGITSKRIPSVINSTFLTIW